MVMRGGMSVMPRRRQITNNVRKMLRKTSVVYGLRMIL
jgi:hypothetical protein